MCRCKEGTDLKRLKPVYGESKPMNYGIYKNNLVCVDYK